MNICTVKLRIKGKVKKKYHFSTIRKVVEFQEVFKNENSVTFEVYHEDLERNSSLVNELYQDPTEYAEREYNRLISKAV